MLCKIEISSICDTFDSMRKKAAPLFPILILLSCALPGSPDGYDPSSRTADHSVTSLLRNEKIPEAAILQAIGKLKIAYGHTSHGSQITDGMTGLVSFANGSLNRYRDNLFSWSHDGSAGLHLLEGAGYGGTALAGDLILDCGYGGWDDETRIFLDNNPGYNVIVWSWCGQVDDVDINSHYLNRMAALEREYPDVVFVYMTGHLEGGEDNRETNGVLANNNAIRVYCEKGSKWLFDFADIEKYNPDGIYFGGKLADDACDYDSDGDGTRDANWAREWRNRHIQDQDWYDCGAAHSDPLNANMKAYAFWWLMARIAGWEG